MSLVLPAPGSPLHQLTIVARELALQRPTTCLVPHVLHEVLGQCGLRQQQPSADARENGQQQDATDWQAKAAAAFHERATLWAGDVSGLGCLGEQAQAEVDRACDRARFAESFAALSLPGGGR